MSQASAAARHTAVLLASAGQALLDPLQKSAASHASTAARQSAVFGLTPSAGQFAPLPVQNSVWSQVSVAARHVVLDGSKALAGQALLVPLQFPAMSNAVPPRGGCFRIGGAKQVEPSQLRQITHAGRRPGTARYSA